MTATRVAALPVDSLMVSCSPLALRALTLPPAPAPARPLGHRGYHPLTPADLEVVVSPRALQNLVGGAAVDAADGATIDLVAPSTGEIFATSPRSGAADVDAACQAAAAAFETWRDTTPSDRQRALLKLADLVEEHAE